MLFYPKRIPGMFKVSYDEPSSTLFIWYTNKKTVDAYRIDRNYFNKQVLPVLDSNSDFRSLLIWGERNSFVQKIENDLLQINLEKYER